MSCDLPELQLCVKRGETLKVPLRIETGEYVWVPITGISRTAPVVVEAPAHGCPDKWDAAVTGVRGMRQINAEVPLKDKSFKRVDVVDPDHVKFNKIDASSFSTYTGGGHLVFYKPLDLDTFVSAHMDVRAGPGKPLLYRFTTDDFSLQLDNVNRSLWINAERVVTAAKEYTEASFDIFLVNGGGEATPLCASTSKITIDPSITELE